jgi:NADH-quinone oxidoreductase subunit I
MKGNKLKGANNTYFGNLAEGIKSSWQGLKVSIKHVFEARRSRKPMGVAAPDYFDQQTGIVTLKYPYEALPVPDNGRYRLHNEMEDCIVCDKCAEICPVDCIEIEAVKSPEEIRKTSDGHSVRLYAAKFDIDMAKCCFCGLCTTVCPTECLTMTKTYDFSERALDHLNYHFSDLSPEEAATKQKAYEDFQAAKLAAKEAAKAEKSAPASPPTDAVPPPGEKPADDPTPQPAAKPAVKRPLINPVLKKPNPDQPNPDA